MIRPFLPTGRKFQFALYKLCAFYQPVSLHYRYMFSQALAWLTHRRPDYIQTSNQSVYMYHNIWQARCYPACRDYIREQSADQNLLTRYALRGLVSRVYFVAFAKEVIVTVRIPSATYTILLAVAIAAIQAFLENIGTIPSGTWVPYAILAFTVILRALQEARKNVGALDAPTRSLFSRIMLD